MTNTKVKCQACGSLLNDSEPNELQNRPPCPRCGSTQRIFEIHVEDRIRVAEQVQIAASGSYGSYLTVPADRLSEIKQMLDSSGQRYWTDSSSFSINKEPPVAIINLWPGSDVHEVERIIEKKQ